MSTRELLASSGAGVSLIDEQILTASGNWLKAAAVKPTDRVIVDMVSGGGSGGYGSNADEVTGGQGGHFIRLEFYAYELPSSVACVVGSGGVAQTNLNNNGNNGGASAFGSVLLPGGGGGLYNTTGFGLILHKRSIELLSSTSLLLDPLESSNSYPNNFFVTENPKMNTEVGGFWVRKYDGSNYLINAADRVYAGAAGGSVNRYLSIQPPGKSLLGGAGGASVASGNSSNGSVPGGGGGGKHSSLGVGNSGAGARGEIRVRVLRGAS